MTNEQIMSAVLTERHRQFGMWAGEHAHGRGDCSSVDVAGSVKTAVLAEESGEVARAFLDGDQDGLRRELVQVAAVAWAWLESLEES